MAIPNRLRYSAEIATILRLGWKLVIMKAMQMSVEVISYVYVGRLGEVYLSSAGLANVTNNVTGNSILTGLVGALSTQCGQAHGARDTARIHELLQRAVLVLLSVCVPLSISWLFSAQLMMFLGQDFEIAHLASVYLLHLIPALYCKAFSLCVESWLTSQQQTEAPAFIGVCTALLHPLWCYLFIFVFDMHYLGSAVAISCTRLLEALSFTGYLIYFNTREKNGFAFTMRATSDWGAYLKLGLPNILMNSQWWAEEVIIFMAGLLPDPAKELAAMSIYQYVIGICYITVKSLGIVGSSRVAFYLGRQDALRAEVAAWVTFALALSVATVQSGLLLTFRNAIPSIFTTEEDVIKLFGSSLVFVLVLYVIADGAQGGLTGVINGMGRQNVAGPVAWLCYYIIALPVSVLCSGVFGVGLTLRVLGLTIGIAVGTWLHAGIYIFIVYTTDWKEQVQLCIQRLCSSSSEPNDFTELANELSDDDGETKPMLLRSQIEVELMSSDSSSKRMLP